LTEQIFLEFENTVEDDKGLSHGAVVLGKEREDGRWIGRIRFTPLDGSPVLETDRETTQPNRDDLAYWATGLTYTYLEGALARARRLSEKAAAAATPGTERKAEPPKPASHIVPRIEVATMSPTVVEEVLEARDPRPGTMRQIPGAGIIVYEGTGGADGASHLFAVQFGSRNAGAVMANWLWSRLHGLGVEVRVNGRVVELTNDALGRALLD
jgi:hypothetical protein